MSVIDENLIKVEVYKGLYKNLQATLAAQANEIEKLRQTVARLEEENEDLKAAVQECRKRLVPAPGKQKLIRDRLQELESAIKIFYKKKGIVVDPHIRPHIRHSLAQLSPKIASLARVRSMVEMQTCKFGEAIRAVIKGGSIEDAIKLIPKEI